MRDGLSTFPQDDRTIFWEDENSRLQSQSLWGKLSPEQLEEYFRFCSFKTITAKSFDPVTDIPDKSVYLLLLLLRILSLILIPPLLFILLPLRLLLVLNRSESKRSSRSNTDNCNPPLRLIFFSNQYMMFSSVSPLISCVLPQ